MEIMEIVLLIAGGIIFVLSFLIPDKGGQGTGMSKELAEEEIRKMVEKEMEAIRSQVDDVVEEAVTYSMEKTERSLERLSNEKIMAVSEYSDTVLSEIHKNHEEAMFLYDMLNSKHMNLKNTVSEVNRTVKEAEETVSGIKKAIPEQPVQEETKKSAADKAKPKTATVKKEEEKANFEPLTARTLNGVRETAAQGQNNNEKILQLYREGKTAVDIAKDLGLGVGEVKLVIGLYKNQ